MDECRHDDGCLKLQGSPVNVEIFNWALHGVETEPMKDVSDLELRLSELLTALKAVTEGREAQNLKPLKAFCLSLHQALLNETSPFRADEDWVFTRE